MMEYWNIGLNIELAYFFTPDQEDSYRQTNTPLFRYANIPVVSEANKAL